MEEISKFCYSTTTTTTTTATTTSITTTTITTTTITHFSTLLLSDFLLFLSFILSHPLYFSYFIFFSPYLLKLLSFLSPLFITTSLLLLAFLTVSPALIGKEYSQPQISESKASFLLNAYQTVINTLRSRLDDQTVEFRPFEELEACIVLVEEYPIEVSKTKIHDEVYDSQIVKFSSSDDQDFVGASTTSTKELTYNVEVNQVEVTQKKYEGTEFHGFLEVSCASDASIHNVEEYPNDPTDTNDKVEESQDKPLIDTGRAQTIAKVICSDNGAEDCKESVSYIERCAQPAANVCADNGGEYTTKRKEDLKKLVQGSSNLEVSGSMRKEKEWKRTLACKLYEERQNVDGSEEGMDLLWESYESDSRKKMKPKKKKEIKAAAAKEDHEYDEEDEDMDHVQMCCLQALKFSTGKMNLGMGRLRISKAFKGIGWFHNASRRSKRT